MTRKMTSGLILAAMVGILRAEDLDLAGRWLLEGTREDGSALTCPIDVPGGVHTALRKANEIPDPFWGRNELKTQCTSRPARRPKGGRIIRSICSRCSIQISTSCSSARIRRSESGVMRWEMRFGKRPAIEGDF